MSGVRKIGPWAKLGVVLSRLSAKSTVAMNSAVGKEAHRIARAMRNIIARGTGPDGPLMPNRPITQFLKGSSKPLIDTGVLLASIQAVKLMPGVWVIGVMRGAPKPRQKSGDNSDIATLLEFGVGAQTSQQAAGDYGPFNGIFQIVTEKQHKFFIFLKMAGLMDKVPPIGQMIWIRFPGRSFVGAAWRASAPGMKERIAKDYLKAMHLHG